jgi:predicted HAD superfamily phosphohydrolase
MEGKKGDPVLHRSGKNSEKALLFTDWEGPWILNDFAYELCLAVFNNERFFRNLSEYDDYLFYVAKRRGYEAGYTLKLLAPFISAFGLDERIIGGLINSAKFVPDAIPASERILKNFHPVVISTAYEKFVRQTAERIGFKTVHGSELDFSLQLDEGLKNEVLKSVDIIASLQGGELIEFMDRLMEKLWDRLAGLKVIGAREKAEILERYEPENPIAIGDSITDCKMFEKARELGGVAVAFNGNRYALEGADVAIVSRSANATAIVAETLLKGGMKPELLKSLKYPRGTRVYIMDEADFDTVLEMSMRMRVKLRGSAGSLG